MSCYLIKGKGWRYDFTLNGQRHTETWFKTKKEARKAEAEKRKELSKPMEKTPTDMAFLDLVNRRLDFMKEYRSARHYQDSIYLAKRWVQEWGQILCGKISKAMVEQFILHRAKVSHHVANKEIRCLKATFNYGIKRELISNNPVKGIEFLPVEKKVRRIPTPAEIEKVISVASQDDRVYLMTIRDTMARVGEVNRLLWDDIDFENETITLYTRKKKDGSLTPRKVKMTKRLNAVLTLRYIKRLPGKPWVFWHRYWSRKAGKMVEGPYQNRQKMMNVLCERAGVPYFRFHPIRHSGASIMEHENVNVGAIQRILGHENRTTTEIYLHSIGNAEKEAIDIFEKASLGHKSHTDSHTKDKRAPGKKPETLSITGAGDGN
jgi:integrase